VRGERTSKNEQYRDYPHRSGTFENALKGGKMHYCPKIHAFRVAPNFMEIKYLQIGPEILVLQSF